MEADENEKTFGGSFHVIGAEHAFGAPENRILGGIVGMIFRRYLQHRRNRNDVGVEGRPNQFGDVLIDEDDGDIFAVEETFEALVDFADARVFVDDEEIRTSSFVHFANASEQESGASVFIADHRD